MEHHGHDMAAEHTGQDMGAGKHAGHDMDASEQAGHDMRGPGHDRHAGHSVAMFRDKFLLSLALTIPVVLLSGDISSWVGYALRGQLASAA